MLKKFYFTVQDKNFKSTRRLLFDGESALKGKAAQNKIFEALNLKVDAQPYFKRSLAERGILELKLRMAIHLNFLGGSPNYVFGFFT